MNGVSAYLSYLGRYFLAHGARAPAGAARQVRRSESILDSDVAGTFVAAVRSEEAATKKIHPPPRIHWSFL